MIVPVPELCCQHDGKHYKAFLDKLKALVDGNDLAELPLAGIIRKRASVVV